MRADATKDRILDKAEELFARDGFSGTSLRAVTGAAGVNLASVNYHFGSKEALLLAAFDRLAAPVNRERLAMLDRLESDESALTLEEVLKAFLTPALRIVVDLGPRGLTATRFLGRCAADPTPAVRVMIAEEFETITKRFLKALSRVLPELAADELLWRFKLMIGVLVQVQADQDWKARLPKRPRPADVDVVRDRTVRFLADGFRAGAQSMSSRARAVNQ